MRRIRFVQALLIAGFLCALASSRTLAAEPEKAQAEFFEREIRPLLVERCHKCHGAEKPKGGLQLISRESLARGGTTGPVVIPGKPSESRLIKAINYQEIQMPPDGRLKEEEIARLTRWVEQGAYWPGGDGKPPGDAKPAAPATDATFVITPQQRSHWAFQPPRHAIPETQDTKWPRSDLDRFVLSKLEARRLSPSSPADKRTLIRRATFDLTGLPPTPQEVQNFLADESPRAFARVVERLLASPHYGEQWARHWLEVVSYAETPDDIELYRYRDWVVWAINRDMPYTRFITEQIAGDLATPAGQGSSAPNSMVATGPLALGNRPGDANTSATDKEQTRCDVVDHQIDVVSSAFLGLTIHCARCHDHKFDPISTDDYYGLAGIFFSTRVTPSVGDETGDKVRDAAIRLLGNPHHLGKVSPRRFPTILAGDKQQPITSGSGRLQLAQWIASAENPLTARVMVNRIWQHHFGRGIVGTPDDFGQMGLRPTHPELLDWLAIEFVRAGWSMKAMHRAIMLSATYQESSEPSESLRLADPANLLLGRMSPRRLDAAEYRDALLCASGQLDRTLYGPAIRDANSLRRSIYQAIARADRPRFSDMPSKVDRLTVVEPQKTTPSNRKASDLTDDLSLTERSAALAGRMLAEAPADEGPRIDWLHQLLYARPAAELEIERGIELLATIKADFRNRQEAERLVWEHYIRNLFVARSMRVVE